MPQLTYGADRKGQGGVTLYYQSTQAMSYKPIYSEDTKDYLYTEITVDATCILTPDIPELTLPGQDWDLSLELIRHNLELPRRRLRVEWDGVPLLDVGPDDDLAGGPFPEVLTWNQFVGTQACLMHYRVRTYVRQCPGLDPLDQPKYLSNRWRESHTIDEDGCSTRTRTGTLIIRPDMGLEPDAFRWVVTPPLPRGNWVRVRADYQIRSDGLALAYTFVDQDRFALPPPPAAKAKGNFYTTSDNGAMLYGTVHVRLTGDPGVSKRALMATAISVAIARLQDAGLAKTPNGRWRVTGSFGEELYENVVDVQLRAILAKRVKPVRVDDQAKRNLLDALRQQARTSGQALTGLTGLMEQLLAEDDATPGDDPQGGVLLPKGLAGLGVGKRPLYSRPGAALQPDIGLRSAAGLRLVAAALNDPCLASSLERDADLESDVASAPTGDTAGARGTIVSSPISDQADDATLTGGGRRQEER